MKDKFGNELTTKEFFQRWKQGIQDITLLQQIKINFIGYVFILVGILIGLYSTYSKTWWLFIILIGSLILTITSFVGNLQKYFILKKLDNAMKGGIENE